MRRGAGRKKKETQPRREDAPGLHLAEPERVRKSLRGRPHITVQAFSFLRFVVFQTSDGSCHVCTSIILLCKGGVFIGVVFGIIFRISQHHVRRRLDG